MAHTVVGILRGGTSSEYEHSLKSGAAVMSALSPEEYDIRDVLVDKQGNWHVRGIPVPPARALAQVDVVVNVLHGGVGEDGTITRVLDTLGMPYVGSDSHATARAYNKLHVRNILREAGIRMPQAVGFTLGTDITTGDMARTVFERIGPPYIIKPAQAGSSHGVVYAPTFFELGDAIGNVLDAHGNAVVEEYVLGEHAVVGVVEQFRGDDVYTLPPARIVVPPGSKHIEPTHYHGALSYILPSDFSHAHKQDLEDAARTAHKALGLSHISSADFILTKRGPVLLEVDTLPHLHEYAHFPAMLTTVGSSLKELVTHLIARARV